MIGHSPHRRRNGALALILVLMVVLTSCGERVSITATGPGPVVRLPAVAQVTMPPGATAAVPVVSPTPRVAEAIVAVPKKVVVKPPVIATEEVDERRTRPSPTPAVPLIGKAEEGRRHFASMQCGACHQDDLSGNIGPKLSGRTPQDLTDARIYQQILKGGNGMPPFPDTTDQEVQDFIALIRSRE